MSHGIVQAERIERGGPQALNDAAHRIVDVAGQLDDRVGAAFDIRIASPRQIANGHRIELDRVDALTHLIVQLARQVAAFFLLHQQIALRQEPVLRQRVAELALHELELGDVRQIDLQLELAARQAMRHHARNRLDRRALRTGQLELRDFERLASRQPVSMTSP